MGDFFVVTAHSFKGHKSFEKAEAERARLQEANPEKRFQVIRCKTILQPSTLYDDLLAFVRRIATREGGVPDLIRREAGGLVQRHDEREAKPDLRSDAA